VGPAPLSVFAPDSAIRIKDRMTFTRAAGILLHPTSLPSQGGIGDFGPAAFRFVDFLRAAAQSLWQVLPLSPVGLGNSPYSATSAFAGNPLLISLELLRDHGWIGDRELKKLESREADIDFKSVNAVKLPLLKLAAENFLRRPSDALGEHERFASFCRDQAWWLEDYVLFSCLRQRFSAESWNKWPRPLARREADAIAKARHELVNELQIERVLQFAFYEQWKSLHDYARKRQIRVVGDVAIFVNYDSADVWTNPEIFYLDAELEPTVVSGVPPDAFSETGQRWGNPLYRWDVLKQRGYDWWIQRMRWATTTCDYVRIDHFRGFEQNWEIPASEPTAVKGQWVHGPKDDLFHALRSAMGDLPFIAEDLGLITPEVDALRTRLNIPGMKVLQFGFGDKGAHMYLPHRYEPNCVVYTGTHDNDTTLGWWETISKAERTAATAYLGSPEDGIHWAMIRAAYGSVAAFAIVPLQDVLGLDSAARMNTPSRTDNNWGWRFRGADLRSEHAAKLSKITETSDREPPSVPSPTGKQGQGKIRK
jgi:4-alpha-glucanotransferase